MEAITKGRMPAIYTYPECVRVLGDRSLSRGSALLHFCIFALLDRDVGGQPVERVSDPARVGEIVGISTFVVLAHHFSA
jgi:hypothetical protein